MGPSLAASASQRDRAQDDKLKKIERNTRSLDFKAIRDANGFLLGMTVDGFSLRAMVISLQINFGKSMNVEKSRREINAEE